MSYKSRLNLFSYFRKEITAYALSLGRYRAYWIDITRGHNLEENPSASGISSLCEKAAPTEGRLRKG
jgi:hypothetical protein